MAKMTNQRSPSLTFNRRFPHDRCGAGAARYVYVPPHFNRLEPEERGIAHPQPRVMPRKQDNPNAQ